MAYVYLNNIDMSNFPLQIDKFIALELS